MRCPRWRMPPRKSSWCCRSPVWPPYSMAPWIGLAVVGSHADRDRQLPAERARVPVWRRRLRGGHHQPRADRRPDGGQRAAGGLRPHGRGVDGFGDVEHRIGGAVHQSAQGLVRGHRDPALGIHKLARYSGVGHRVRDPDLCVHDRDVHHAGLGPLPDLRPRRAVAGRIRLFRPALRTRRRARVRAGVPGRPGVLVGQCGADRRRGDQQRGAGLPETQVAQRGNHAAAAGRHLGHVVHGHHHAGQGDRREDRGAAARTADRCATPITSRRR